MGSIPGLGRSPGGGFDNLLEYSCLENPMDRVVWQSKVHRVAKSQTGSDLALVYIEELEKDMASLSCVLAWRIPWREDPGWLQSTGLQRVRHNLATKPPTTTTTLSNTYCLERFTEKNNLSIFPQIS